MKEAAGEANMTIVTIVLIAIVLGAGTLIVTNIMKGMGNNKQTICSQLGGSYGGGICTCPDGTTVSPDTGIAVKNCSGGTTNTKGDM